MPPAGRFKDRKEGKASSGLCYYHNKYGDEALKCKKQNAEGIPCPMHGEWEEKTENGALKNESQQEDTKKQRQNGQPQQEIEEEQPKKDEVVPDATMILQTRSSKEVSIAPTVKNNGEWNDELHLSEMLRRTYDPFEPWDQTPWPFPMRGKICVITTNSTAIRLIDANKAVPKVSTLNVPCLMRGCGRNQK